MFSKVYRTKYFFLYILIFISLIVTLWANKYSNRIDTEFTHNDHIATVMHVNKPLADTLNLPTHTGPNIVIFLIDTLRADRLQPYGYPKPTSPNIDSLAQNGTLFTRADAAGAWTLPSVSTLMTSRYPVEHKVLIRKTHVVDPVLAEKMQLQGYETASFYANPWVGGKTGLIRGFDYEEVVSHTNGAKIQQYLDARQSDRPFFLYIHNLEPHNPANPYVQDKYTELFGHVEASKRQEIIDSYSLYLKIRKLPVEERKDLPKLKQTLKSLNNEGYLPNLYDASILLADELLGEVVTVLKENKLWDNTLFIFLSDHGEEFDEHDDWFHGQSVHREIAHIPLIMHFPNQQYPAQRLDHPVSLIDIMPTIMDYIGHPLESSEVSGESFLPLIQGNQKAKQKWDQTIRFTTQRFNTQYVHGPFEAQYGIANIVIRQENWKGIWNPLTETILLYDLLNDPMNMNDISKENPDVCQAFITATINRFGTFYDDYPKENGEWIPKDEQNEILEALGYL